MSSTYSTTLRIQLIDTGTEDEAWGTPTDNNLGTVIEQAITGVEAVSLTNLTSYTLTASNAVADQSRNAVLLFTGNLNANCNVIAPSVQKVYVISNQTTNNKAITIKTSGGNGIQLANGTNQLVYCNGTTFFSAVNVNTILGDLAVSGNATIAGTKITLGTSVISQNTSNLTFNAPTSNVISFYPTTGGFTPPSGTVAQRPASPVVGMSRWNTDYSWYEIWNGVIWQQITGSFVVNYLIVAGGGGCQFNTSWAGGSGSGAGGFITNALTVDPMTSFAVVVGAGGAGVAYTPANNGGNSSVFGYTAIGGGASTQSGGSGGGGGYLTGGAGTSGQGNNGGYYPQGGVGDYGSGSGGGAGAAGTGGDNQAGGIGLASSITGTSTYYAGGGGSSSGTDSTGGAGGLGGGGSGGSSYGKAGSNGVANTGGGGGAANGDSNDQYPFPSIATNGGSGVVIISYASSFVRATGGTITTYSSGGDTYYVHKFTSSGTFATIQDLTMPSTYSPSLKIELIANGEQAGTWGQTTNNNMGTLIEQAITGVGSLDLTGYSSYTLTNFNGLADEARNAVLVFSGIPSSACNVIAPTVEKTYVVTNNSTANVVIKTSTGNGTTILPNVSALIYCDGVEFYTAVNVNNVIGDLTVTGNVSVAGGTINLASSSMVSNANSMTFRSSSGIINMNTNTGAFTPPTGTTAQRPSSLAAGMSRWNTSTSKYEIWTGTAWQAITA